MKRTFLLLFISILMSITIWSCGGTPSCPLFCPPGGAPNVPLDKVVDVQYCDGRRRTYRLGFDGCTPFLVADPNKHESCLLCGFPVVRRVPFFSFFPFGAVNLLDVPSSFRFSGDPSAEVLLSTTYGNPVVNYRDSSGMVIGSGTVTAVAPDGTWLDATPPDLSSAFTGTYTIHINNVLSNGDYLLVGTSTMDAYGREPPDSDGDGVPDYMDCAPYNPAVQACGGGGGDEGGGCDPDCILY